MLREEKHISSNCERYTRLVNMLRWYALSMRTSTESAGAGEAATLRLGVAPQRRRGWLDHALLDDVSVPTSEGQILDVSAPIEARDAVFVIIHSSSTFLHPSKLNISITIGEN